MNPAYTMSSAFMRRLARTPLRRRLVVPSRQLSSSAPLFRRQELATDPYSSTAMAALLARLSLPSTPELQKQLLTCLTHTSFSEAEAADPEGGASAQENNELLATLGNSLLGLFATEEVASRYPNLPTVAISNAVTSYVGPSALQSVGRELGISVTNYASTTVLPKNAPSAVPIRWKQPAYERKYVETPVAPGFRKEGEESTEVSADRRKAGFSDCLASVVRAFVGLIYQEQGIAAARQFVHAHFLSRHVDMANLFNFRNPKYVLSGVVAKHLADAGVALTPQSSRIESRVLASSGAATQAPLFNIGLFLSNGLKLAEGHGSSLAMAEHRAATNALLSLYLVQNRNEALPTSAHADRPLQTGAKGLETLPTEGQFRPNLFSVGQHEPVSNSGRALRRAL